MVRLPARLTSKLVKARIAQTLKSAPPGPLVHCVDSAEVLHAGSTAPVSRERMHGLIASHAPVIWVGGSEPLLHAGIGHFVRAIAQSGHYVFLETDGTSLRRRIHEFQPLPELFLTVRLDSLQALDPDLALEGLRAAHLSGFFTVIHSQVHKDSDIGQFINLRSFINEKDIDGWLITAASRKGAAPRNVTEARGLIRSIFWRQFSKHVEAALLSQVPDRKLRDAPAFDPEHAHTEAAEESVRIA